MIKASSLQPAPFIEPMQCKQVERLPDGPEWLYEIKLDGYRAVGIKSGGPTRLMSRNQKDFSAQYPTLVTALNKLPDETVVDGEIVALDSNGRPSFQQLQNYGSSVTPLTFYLFDLPHLAGQKLAKRTADREA
jgi:ATP-dependent DNA ligase